MVSLKDVSAWGVMARDPTADPVYERWYNGDHTAADFIEAQGVSVMEFTANMLESLGFEPAQATERRSYDGRGLDVDLPEKYELNPLPAGTAEEDDTVLPDGGRPDYRVTVAVSGTEHRIDSVDVQEFDHDSGAKMEWSLSGLDDLMQYVVNRDQMAPQFGELVEGEEMDIEPYDVADETALWEYGTGRRL